MMKLKEDELSLSRSLTMAYQNAYLKLSDSKRTIDAQRRIWSGREVFAFQSQIITGNASLSDVLMLTFTLQSQISYADANKYMTAYIDYIRQTGQSKT
jgi:hypothetical protein